MAREDFINKDFEYFNVTTYVQGPYKEVIDLREDTVAIVLDNNHVVQLNQLDVFAKSASDYHSVILDKQTILDLADYIRSQG
jgi:hypothetical protein